LPRSIPGTAKTGTTYCIGKETKCVVVFPASDDFDVTALLVDAVDVNVRCPAPGVCDEPAGDQLDALVLLMRTGSSGMADPGAELDNFSLIPADGSQATIDSVTCDRSVEYALCGLGPEGANAYFWATIFYDAPAGTTYSEVNFSYESGLSQLVYTFTRANSPVTPTKGKRIAIRHIGAKGGKVEWTIRVSNAARCVWSSSPNVKNFNGSVKCHTGRVQRTAYLAANKSVKARAYTLDVKVLGKTRTTQYLKIVQASPIATIVTATVRVESNPASIAVNPLTNDIYFANVGFGTVSAIDGATNAVAATVRVSSNPDDPQNLAVDPVTNTIYVVDSNNVAVINGATNRVTGRIGAAYAVDAAVDSSRNMVYTVTLDEMLVINGATKRVTATAATNLTAPWSVAVDSSTNNIYVTNWYAGIKPGPNTVSVINGATDSITATIKAGRGPEGVAVDPRTDTIYVANSSDRTVSVINGATNKVRATVRVGNEPDGVAVDPSTNTIYVTNAGSGTVSVINGATDKVIATVRVGYDPLSVAVNPSTNTVYVANLGHMSNDSSGTVSVIECAT
jgi:YVTN family beta-propeller protein